MSYEATRLLASENEAVDHIVRFVGGTTAVTKVFGRGITCTYVSSGVVDLVWAENPGTFLTLTGTFQATTPANVKSYVVVPGAFNTSTFTLRLSMYESGTLTDLDALEWLSCRIAFKRTAV